MSKKLKKWVLKIAKQTKMSDIAQISASLKKMYVQFFDKIAMFPKFYVWAEDPKKIEKL